MLTRTYSKNILTGRGPLTVNDDTCVRTCTNTNTRTSSYYTHMRAACTRTHTAYNTHKPKRTYNKKYELEEAHSHTHVHAHTHCPGGEFP